MNNTRFIAVWPLVTASILLQPADPVPSNPPSGTIAYIRGSTEIRLIDPNGTNERRLWTHPDARAALGINDLAWRPDGKELAFSSGHAAATSLYDADIYTLSSPMVQAYAN
jgi:Tol biopolymer transport system component